MSIKNQLHRLFSLYSDIKYQSRNVFVLLSNRVLQIKRGRGYRFYNRIHSLFCPFFFLSVPHILSSLLFSSFTFFPPSFPFSSVYCFSSFCDFLLTAFLSSILLFSCFSSLLLSSFLFPSSLLHTSLYLSSFFTVLSF